MCVFLTFLSCFFFLQLIPQISSLTPVTTIVPLVAVLAITALKDAIDDIVSFFKLSEFSLQIKYCEVEPRKRLVGCTVIDWQTIVAFLW